MGVMECDRRGCKHILCDRLILGGTHYICGECWSELLAYKDTWVPPMTRGELEDKIVEFMKTKAGSTRGYEWGCDIDEVFDELTGG